MKNLTPPRFVNKQESALMTTVTRAVFAAFTVCILGMSGLGVSSAADPIRIGAILSYSGPSAPLGLPQVNALKLAETQINAHGGIAGRQVHFEIVDDEAKADVASQLATQQIASGVAAIICGTRVDTTNAVARITAQAGVLQIILTPTISTWKSKTGAVTKTIFEAQASDELEGRALLTYAKRKLNVKKIAFMHDANFFGTSGAEIVTDVAKTMNVDVVGNEAYAGDATDFTPQIQKLMAANPDAIVLWGATTTPALVTKAIRTLGYTKPILASGGVDSEAFLKIAGPAANGMYAAGNVSKAHQSATQESFIKLYESTYKIPAVTFALQAWDASLIIAAAIKGTGGKTDGKSLSAWLEKGVPITATQSVFKFSASDHNGQTIDAVHMIVPQNGVWVDAPA
jgi:branched-chain amino acid transport system substrate-binding protein